MMENHLNELITEAPKWAGNLTVIEVERRREIKDKIEKETQYYIFRHQIIFGHEVSKL